MKNLHLRILKTATSMFIIALGIVAMMAADIGLNPWWTFSTGLSELSGLSVGLVVQAMGLLFIVIAYLLGVKPGITTILDMILVGLYVDLIRQVPLPVISHYSLQVLVLLIGLGLFCLGLSLTLTTGLGAGPKDSFTLALMKKTNSNINRMKLIVEGVIFILGVLIGGPFGIGTIISTLFTGYILTYFFKLLRFDPKVAL